MNECKKLFTLLIFLSLLIFIPHAFAADLDNSTQLTSDVIDDESVGSVEVADNVINSDTDLLNANDEGNVLSSDSDAIYVSTEGNDKNDGSESAPFATIYRAVNVALDSGITDIYVLEGTYRENSIPIETSVNIIGLGNVVIDAEKNDRIFKIDGEYEVTLSNLTLINGVAPTDGVSEDIHEIVYYAAGGAVSIVTAYVKMNYMTFINNTAADFGGAVNVEAQNCLIKNSVFKYNYADVFGGAVDFEDNNATIENCTFVFNEAGNGGAVGCIASACSIINSYFENNTAENGAAIFIENGDLTADDSNSHLIQNNIFIHNEATQQGGAIEVENQQMSENADWTLIDNNKFIDNYAYNGGAISAYYGDAGISNNIFNNNSAGYGGAIASISTTDSPFIVIGGIYLKNNTITNCIAEENGNAIYNMGYYGTSVNITFIGGKTIYSNDGKAVILNVSVCDDMGNPISGSPIDFTVDGVKTINPATDLYEGVGSVRFVPRHNGTFNISGVFNNKFNTNRINLVMGTIVVENAIEDYFGTVHVSQYDGDDDNTGAETSPVKTFTMAYILATRDGGSFDIVVNKGTYQVPGYTIEQSFNITGIDNPVLDGKNQGTLFSLYGSPNDEFHITGITFINGVASSSKYAGMNEGGAIFFKGGNLYLENDTFSTNSATDYGGAVHINKGMDYNSGLMYGAFAYINNCTFNNNLAKYFGGAISLYDCDVVVNNSCFNSNNAKRGGAISILNGMGNLTVANSIFNKNTASETGGALDVEALDTYNVKYFADISNSTFSHNSAKYGGAVMGLDNTITNCIFDENSAEIWGGAILFNDTTSTVSYSIFENNHAEEGSSYYGYSDLIDNNFWGTNFKSGDEIKKQNIAIIKNDTESRSWINPVVVNDTNIKSWVNININADGRVLPGIYNVTVEFTSNNQSDLNSVMPRYDVKVTNKDSANKLSADSISIVDNTAALTYSALNESNDVISIVNNYNTITHVDINVYVRKNTTISLENKSYDVTSQLKTVEAVLKDTNGNIVSNRTVVIHIGDKVYANLTDEKGIATFVLDLNEADTYNVQVEFSGDEDYFESNNISTVNIVKVSTKLTIQSKTFVVTSNSKVLTVVLNDVYGNPLVNKTLSLKINSKAYNITTDTYGKASLKVSLTNVKSYKYTVNFAGDENYTAVSGEATVKVTKQKTKLIVAKKTYKKASKNKKLIATLKTSAGKVIAKKKVIFKINGKTYKATTNSKGKATVKVKLTAKKTYKVTVKFAGDSKFFSATKKSTVKIK